MGKCCLCAYCGNVPSLIANAQISLLSCQVIGVMAYCFVLCHAVNLTPVITESFRLNFQRTLYLEKVFKSHLVITVVQQLIQAYCFWSKVSFLLPTCNRGQTVKGLMRKRGGDVEKVKATYYIVAR